MPKLHRAATLILEAIGEDPSRDGLRDTPRRFADSWAEFIGYDPGRFDTTFSSESTDQMIVVSGMRAWSLCEHHLLPFWCDVAIAYIPRGRILGLSKFMRVVSLYSHRLQVQERLAEQIAHEIGCVASTPDVAVLCKGEHLCMTMRGVRTPAVMSTSVMHGVFRDEPSARAEFLRLVH